MLELFAALSLFCANDKFESKKCQETVRQCVVDERIKDSKLTPVQLYVMCSTYVYKR